MGHVAGLFVFLFHKVAARRDVFRTLSRDMLHDFVFQLIVGALYSARAVPTHISMYTMNIYLLVSMF